MITAVDPVLLVDLAPVEEAGALVEPVVGEGEHASLDGGKLLGRHDLTPTGLSTGTGP